jgi:hypothetical protein
LYLCSVFDEFTNFKNYKIMKKYLLILLVALVGVGFTSCKKKAAGTVVITVTDVLGEPVKGTDVCVFTSYEWTNESHILQNALYNKATDANGEAIIKIDGFWLNENGTTFYCALCNAQGIAIDSEQITVKPGETVEVAF